MWVLCLSLVCFYFINICVSVIMLFMSIKVEISSIGLDYIVDIKML